MYPTNPGRIARSTTLGVRFVGVSKATAGHRATTEITKAPPPVRSAVAARGSVPANSAGFKAISPTALQIAAKSPSAMTIAREPGLPRCGVGHADQTRLREASH